MRTTLLLMALNMLVKLLTPELMAQGFEYVKGRLESLVAGTGTRVDDIVYGALKGERDSLRVFFGVVLDFVEEFVLGTVTLVDDALVLPVCGTIRVALDIPDDE